MEIEFRNDMRESLNIVIEPWADELSVPVNKKAVLSFPQEKVCLLTIKASPGYLSVFVEDRSISEYMFELR